MSVRKVIKEACIEGIEQASLAEKKGAQRIEYCANLKEGGTTPSFGELKVVLSKLHIPVAVMIRPRGGNFCYSPLEIEVMIADITEFKKIGVNHFVFGVLTKSREIHKKNTKRLIEACKGSTVTFHRAFDDVKDQYLALETLIQLGCHKVLTSGGEERAILGKKKLNKLIFQAGSRITVIPGAGITAQNIEKFLCAVQCCEVHGTKIV
ncbi:MAG: copper homeostasis protein CutC [Fusobacteria bacterium]|nr:copper homeostasis protein CutC [Fusobacteriota bacterium]